MKYAVAFGALLVISFMMVSGVWPIADDLSGIDAAGQKEGDMVRFPTLITKSLNGNSLTLPRDFAGEVNLVLIGYVEQDQVAIDTWFPLADELVGEYDGFDYYELPTVGEMNVFGRMQLDFWMRAGIPDIGQRGRTLTLYIDRDNFRESLAIETDRTIAVLLLDGNGDVIWRALGPYTDAAGRSLREAVAAAMANG